MDDSLMKEQSDILLISWSTTHIMICTYTHSSTPWIKLGSQNSRPRGSRQTMTVWPNFKALQRQQQLAAAEREAQQWRSWAFSNTAGSRFRHSCSWNWKEKMNGYR